MTEKSFTVYKYFSKMDEVEFKEFQYTIEVLSLLDVDIMYKGMNVKSMDKVYIERVQDSIFFKADEYFDFKQDYINIVELELVDDLIVHIHNNGKLIVIE